MGPKFTLSMAKFKLSFFIGSAMAATYTCEGQGLAGEGWSIKPEVLAGICAEFSEAFSEAFVDSS